MKGIVRLLRNNYNSLQCEVVPEEVAMVSRQNWRQLKATTLRMIILHSWFTYVIITYGMFFKLVEESLSKPLVLLKFVIPTLL